MLIHKFKLKYGNKPNISSYIDNEVTKYLKNSRLTENSLKMLDEKINKESAIRDKKEAILDDRKSQRSNASRPMSQHSRRSGQMGNADAKSIASSRISGVSAKQLQQLSQTSKQDQLDRMSMLTSEKAQSEAFSELNEEDEWVAIQKFNTLLHYEEQKQAIMRDAERKRLIRQELDNQMNEKKRRA